MKVAPAFQFYASDWLGSTKIALMSPEEEGAYIHLLAHAWNDPSCSIPTDEKELAKLSRLGKRWGKCRIKILNCFIRSSTTESRYVNERLLLERAKQDEYHEKQRRNAVLGAEARWHRDADAIPSAKPNDADGMHPAKPNDASSSSSSSSKERVAAGAADSVFKDSEASGVADVLIGIWNAGLPPAERIRKTPGRVTKVATRLKDFSADQLSAAVRGLKASKWHNGENARGWRVPGPEWVLHSTERVEQFLKGNGVKVAPKSYRCPMCLDTGKLIQAGTESECGCVRLRGGVAR